MGSTENDDEYGILIDVDVQDIPEIFEIISCGLVKESNVHECSKDWFELLFERWPWSKTHS